MKQNDWIVLGVCGVFAIAMVIVAITQARTPETPPKPTPVPLSKVAIPGTPVAYTPGLPGSSQNGGGGGPSVAAAGGPPPGAAAGARGAAPGGGGGGGKRGLGVAATAN